MTNVTNLLGDIMLISNDEFSMELKNLKSCTINTLKEQLDRLNLCIKKHFDNQAHHSEQIAEVKNMINKYGITIHELHTIESELINDSQQVKPKDISKRIVLEQFISGLKI